MISRREFISLSAAAGAAATLPSFAQASNAKVVIIGGGVGGATFAKYLKKKAPNTQVILIEQNPVYIRPYGSSEVLTGHIDMSDLEVNYDALHYKYGVEIVIDRAIGLDADKRRVKTASGAAYNYDRLVVSPGIELQYDRIDGYSRDIAETKAPSGWIPGSQTSLLRDQIQNMRQGGTMLIVAPPNPYRCPPGPYERGALVAEWMQKHNPTGKVIIADPKNEFTTGKNMRLAWNRRYGYNIPESYKNGMPNDVIDHKTPGMIDWITGDNGGKAISLDAKNMTLTTESEKIKADVINIVPPMRAGKIAQTFGLTNEAGWCSVSRSTFESQKVPFVHVLGDAAIADDMPKSGYAANTQAKVAAYAIANLLAGRPVELDLTWENTCFALGASDYGFFVTACYKLKNGRITKRKAPALQSLDADEATLRLSAIYQQAWMKSFTEDCFA